MLWLLFKVKPLIEERVDKKESFRRVHILSKCELHTFHVQPLLYQNLQGFHMSITFREPLESLTPSTT
jgi:hypothetical protein